MLLRLLLRIEFVQHVLARPIETDSTTAHHHQPVKLGHDVGSVGDHKKGCTGQLELLDGRRQGTITDIVEIGIGLIEDNQPRVAIQGTGQGLCVGAALPKA